MDKSFCMGCHKETGMVPDETPDGVPIWACVECDRWKRRMTEAEVEEYGS